VSTAFTVIAVVLAVIIALIVAGFGCLIGGFVTLLSVPPVGVCLIGVGFILLGLCEVTVIPLIKLIWKCCVACLNGAVRAVRCFFGIGGDR
jgi:hypothetical protein